MIETQLNRLRLLPGVWISLIITSRNPEGELAWSITCKYDSPTGHKNVQYLSTQLGELLDMLENHLAAHGIKSKPKMKLKRSTS